MEPAEELRAGTDPAVVGYLGAPERDGAVLCTDGRTRQALLVLLRERGAPVDERRAACTATWRVSFVAGRLVGLEPVGSVDVDRPRGAPLPR